MSYNQQLISLKDNSCYAISWVAGTNPNALRKAYKRSEIDGVCVPKLCNQLMSTLESKNNSNMEDQRSKLNFCILTKLTFGTIQIFAQQATHALDDTVSFYARSSFEIRKITQKRQFSTITEDLFPNPKKRRITCSSKEMSTDLSTLLENSVTIDEWSENLVQHSEANFQTPLCPFLNSNDEPTLNICNIQAIKEQTTIQIPEITYREINWEITIPELAEDGFGDETFQQRLELLHMLSGPICKANKHKRKALADSLQCSPTAKKSYDFPIDISQKENDLNNNLTNTVPLPIVLLEPEKESLPSFNITDVDDFFLNIITENNIALNSTAIADAFPANQRELNPNNYVVEESDLNLIEITKEQNIKKVSRKRRSSHRIVDKSIKLSRDDMCNDSTNYAIGQCITKEEIANKPTEYDRPEVMFKKPFRINNLNTKFKRNLKLYRMKSFSEYKSIVQSIFTDSTSDFTNEICPQRKSMKANNSGIAENLKIGVDNGILSKSTTELQMDNILIDETVSQNQSAISCSKSHKDLSSFPDELDLTQVELPFKSESRIHSSDWGHRGIMERLINALKTGDPGEADVASIFKGANRLCAAIAFHSLLDLSAKHFIEIVGDASSHQVKSVKLGPTTLKFLVKNNRTL